MFWMVPILMHKNMQLSGLENLYRRGQNNKLWRNDSNCLLLSAKLPESQYMFHSSLLYATGGALLSGDDITTLRPNRLTIFKKVIRAKL